MNHYSIVPHSSGSSGFQKRIYHWVSRLQPGALLMMSLRVPDSLPLDVGCLPHATLLCGPGFAPRDANEVLARATDAGVLCAALTGCYRWLFRKMSKSMGDLQGLYQAIFCWDSPLHRPYKSFIRSRYLQLRILKWPLIKPFQNQARTMAEQGFLHG